MTIILSNKIIYDINTPEKAVSENIIIGSKNNTSIHSNINKLGL
ncbi:hypothetical protein [Methanobrevibacter sp.]|nr:hypothetical protein [uncultured Methanobrevibacter sp.]